MVVAVVGSRCAKGIPVGVGTVIAVIKILSLAIVWLVLISASVAAVEHRPPIPIPPTRRLQLLLPLQPQRLPRVQLC